MVGRMAARSTVREYRPRFRSATLASRYQPGAPSGTATGRDRCSGRLRRMRPLSAVERFFERLFERPSARLFRARLHPVQVLRAVERAMERERRGEGGRTVVPDRFTVRLHPTDLAGLAPAEGLPVELASGALAFARRHGYALGARPRVAVIPDGASHPGEAHVEARYSDPASGPDLGEVEAAANRTRVFVVPAARRPRATLGISEPQRASRRIVADGGPLTIGRADTKTLVLADPPASP